MKGFIGLLLALAAVAPLNAEVRVAAPLLAALEQGTSWKIADPAVAVKTWDVLPLVENEYSRVFVFDTSDVPKLLELREKQGLALDVAIKTLTPNFKGHKVASGRNGLSRECRDVRLGPARGRHHARGAEPEQVRRGRRDQPGGAKYLFLSLSEWS